MTVRELIEALERLNADDLDVYYDDGGLAYDVNEAVVTRHRNGPDHDIVMVL